MYYVYAYLRDDGTPYYIGKGKARRAWNHTKKDTIHPPKDKSKIILLESNLTNIGACAIERRLIRWYGRIDLGTGILRNLTDGGEGNPGLKMSEESRKKMSRSRKGLRKGIPTWNKGKRTGPQSQEEKDKKSATLTGYIQKQETVDKRAKSLAGNKNGRGIRKRIVCPYCQKEGGAGVMERWHFDNCPKRKPGLPGLPTAQPTN